MEEFPEMVLLELFAHLPQKEVACTCPLVCKSWHRTASMPLLWERLFERIFARRTRRRWKGIAKLMELSSKHFVREYDTQPLPETTRTVTFEEFLAKEIEEAAGLCSMNSGAEAPPHKKLCIWNSRYDLLRWDKTMELEPRLDQEKALRVFAHSKGVVQIMPDINHRDMKALAPFGSGRHRWRLMIQGLDANYWVAAGVAREQSTLFSYSGGYTIGFASNGVVLSPEGEKNDRVRPWDNGNVVELILDCEAHTLTLHRQGQDILCLHNLPDMPLWPWVNMYNPGASLLLLD